MSRIVRITESDLRGAIADERYWCVGHPERGAFQNWVGRGFRGLNPSDGEARSVVWVQAYVRDGHQVSAHWRSARPKQDAGERFDAGTPIQPTLRSVGGPELMGAALHPSLPTLSPVWQLDGEEGEIDYFFNSHRYGFHMAWCEDRRFAIHGDPGNYNVYSGPEDLVRAALPPFLIGAAATRKNAEEIEWEHGPGCMDAILEHYAPFMLNDD